MRGACNFLGEAISSSGNKHSHCRKGIGIENDDSGVLKCWANRSCIYEGVHVFTSLAFASLCTCFDFVGQN